MGLTLRAGAINFFSIIHRNDERVAMGKKSFKTGRRGFLGAAAASVFTGYSMIVKAPQVLAEETVKKLSNASGAASGVSSGAASGAEGSKPQIPFFTPSMAFKSLDCDVLVAGGGLSGICAAISAARKGMKVIIVQDRSRLGGNASSEIRMHPLGVPSRKVGWREGGLIEELKLENAARNPQLSWEVWDLILFDKCVSEPNIKLILDTSVCGAECENSEIKAVYARSDATQTAYKIAAKIYVDATGDARLGIEAGAEYMSGRDGSKKYGESLADYDEVGTRQGSSLMMTSRLYDRPMPFVAPKWAKKITPEQLKYRQPRKNELAYGYWWIELGGVYDAIKDAEMLRFELLSIVMGVWDYVKNSGKYPAAANRALDFVGMLPGRRETYRLAGGHVLTQHDIEGGWKKFSDAVAVGGWTMDDHPAKGFYASERKPCRQHPSGDFYNIPFGSLYSKNIKNLMMPGRNASCSHVAFTSTRVMCTCAAMGQAVGTAAAMCVELGKFPSEIRADAGLVKKLQQTLLRDDQTIIGLKNEDEADLARGALVSASGSTDGSLPQNILSGVCIDARGENKNRWVADAKSKPWIQLDWTSPRKISRVRIKFESGFETLTMTGSEGIVAGMVKGPQPKLVKDYKLTAVLFDNSEVTLADVKGNYQKLVEHAFAPVNAKSVRLSISETNGAPKAYVNEIRVEA